MIRRRGYGCGVVRLAGCYAREEPGDDVLSDRGWILNRLILTIVGIAVMILTLTLLKR